MNEAKAMPNTYFRGMALILRLREKLVHPEERLRATGLRHGQVVLDYGCGVGSYSLPAARLVAKEGKVYALDIHPLAIEAVAKRARKEGLENLETIHSAGDTGLPDGSIDVVLLYDVLHMVPDRQALLRELYRILKPGGQLLVKPDHMTEEALLQTVGAAHLFSLETQHEGTFEFRKNGHTEEA